MAKRATPADRALREKYGRRKRGEQARKIASTATEDRVERDSRFIDAYVGNGRNAYYAAEAVGLAALTGPALAKRLRQRIDERIAAEAAKLAFTADEVVADLCRAQRFDPRALFDPATGKLRPLSELDLDAARMLEGVDVEWVQERSAWVAKVRWAKPVAVRDQAMKYFGLYARDNEQRKTDPEEAARIVREALGQVDDLTAARAAMGKKERDKEG